MAEARELIFGLKTKNASKASDDIKKVDKSLDDAKKSASGLKDESDKSGKSLLNLAKTSEKLKSIGNNISNVSNKIKSVGSAITKATLPIAGALTGGYKMFLDVDKGIRQVQTLADTSILPVDKIREETKRISNMAGIAQTEVAGAMYDALSSSVDTKDLVSFTESAVKLTKAGFTDMGTVIDSTTTVLNAYGDQADSVSKIHDIFVKTQDKGKITVDELGKSIGRVIPIAAASGVKLDQLGASYSILTAGGFNAADATTGLRSMLSELSKTGTKVDKVLRNKTSKSFNQLMKEGSSLGDVLKIVNESAKEQGMTMTDLFGNINAGNAALALFREGAEGYNDMLKEMQNSDGSVDLNFDIVGSSPAEKLAKSTEKLKNALIDLGGMAAPYIGQVADAIGKVVDKFESLDDGTKDSIVQWGLLLVALGPVVSFIGTLGSVIGGVVSFVGVLIGGLGTLSSIAGVVAGAFQLVASALGPIGWIAMAVIGVIWWLAENFASIKARAEELGGGFGWLQAILEQVGASFSAMGDVAVSALDWVKQKWEEVKEFLKNPIKGVISIVSNVVNGVKNAVTGAKSHATGLDYVPHDNYLANLHKGEIVLTAKASEEYRSMGGTKDGFKGSSTSITNSYDSTSNISSPEISNIRNEDIRNTSLSNSTDSKETNISPVVTINVMGADSPIDTAEAVRNEFENLFRSLRLQRV